MAGLGRHRLGVVVVAAALLCGACGQGHQQTVPTCTSGDVVLTPEQAANAATIAAVGRRLGVPDHGVTIALATAFQESGLRNLDYGDRDSLGLFQQRPSQGWGPPAVIRVPRLAAAAFYAHLKRVPGWRSLPVTVAAQRVQHSGAPDAYAQWETPARTLARALTGEVPAGLACHYDPPSLATAAELRTAAFRLRTQALSELGPGGLWRATTSAVVWATAIWLVAQAPSYHLSRVSVKGQVWEARVGAWRPDPLAGRLAWS